MFVSSIIILAALAVGANSILKENSAQAQVAPSNASFSSSIKAEGDKAGETQAPHFSFNQVVDSLQTVDEQAAGVGVVFIALPAKGKDLPPAVSQRMELMLGKLPQPIGMFTLKPGAADYDLIVQKLEIKSLPSFVALGRQGSSTVIPSDDLSETNLLKAYLLASKGGTCCPPVAEKTPCCTH